MIVRHVLTRLAASGGTVALSGRTRLTVALGGADRARAVLLYRAMRTYPADAAAAGEYPRQHPGQETIC